MMKKTFLNAVIAMILCLASTVYASHDNTTSDLQDKDGQTNSANTVVYNLNSDDYLNRLPNEIKLQICQELSVKDIGRFAGTNQSSSNMLTLNEVSKAIAIQQSHPNIDLHMKDLLNPVIKSILTGKAIFTIHRNVVSVYGIRNDGSLLTDDIFDDPRYQNDLDYKEECNRILYPSTHLLPLSLSPEYMINIASANHEVFAGNTYEGTRIDRNRKAFITTDRRTIEFLQVPDDDVLGTCARKISADSSTVIGDAYCSGNKRYGFMWTRKTGMKILSREKLESCILCISPDGNMSGGCNKNEKESLTEALLWTKDTRALYLKDLLIQHPDPAIKSLHFLRVIQFSPNGMQLCGTLKNHSQHLFWTLNCAEDVDSK